MPKNTEIERKFLVATDAFIKHATCKHEIRQGYLCKEKGKTIRVRISDEMAFLTIKSSKLREGIARFEWEKEIDIEDARELLQMCEPRLIEKTRYIIPCTNAVSAMYEREGERNDRKWEVDVFHGRLDGLIVAEIELEDEYEEFEKPEWLGEEVTSDPRYTNSYLSAASDEEIEEIINNP